MEIVKNLMEASMQNSSNTDLLSDEFLKDGRIYCKNCNTPRTTVMEVLGVNRNIKHLCKCQAKKRDAEELQRKEMERQKRMEKLQQASLLSERYRSVTFENTTLGRNSTFDEAYNRCKKYCQISNEVLEKGMGIYIWGDKGTGKTHLTCCMANELIRQYKQVLLTNFFEISKSIMATYNNNGDSNEMDLVQRIASVDFLFIDDLGTEKLTKNGEDTWLQSKIYDVINKRYNAMKPTIFTSNYSLPTLIEERGLMDKTADRILQMSTAIIKIEGESNRAVREKNILF